MLKRLTRFERQHEPVASQAQFDQGRGTLKDLEAAHLDENDKWLAFLDANYARQQAQLELLRTTGQVAKVLQ